MKRFVRSHWLLVAVLLISLTVGLFFSVKKSGLFIDEIYSYGLSNGYYTPFISYIYEGDLIDTVLTQEDLTSYMTVNDDRFAFDSVYYNQTQDVHPPLHYWLLHLVSSLVPGGFTKWTGLALNLVLYLALLTVLYKLAEKLTGSPVIAAIVSLLYGVSRGGLSTLLMIRMYLLLAFLTVLLVYAIVCLIQKERPYLYIVIGGTIFLGLLTQYYFVFYAFFLCAAYMLYALIKKRYRSMLWFAVAALLGVAVFVAV